MNFLSSNVTWRINLDLFPNLKQQIILWEWGWVEDSFWSLKFEYLFIHLQNKVGSDIVIVIIIIISSALVMEPDYDKKYENPKKKLKKDNQSQDPQKE